MKLVIKGLLVAILAFIAFVAITNVWVIKSTRSQVFSNYSIPNNDVALVLGTSKWSSKGRINRFFAERMNSAARLYKTGKVKHILVSGDNGTSKYNEPRDMLQSLGELNVPEEDISLDFAGFRTLDSVIRSKEVFGQDTITIVTQQFHCYRSLFIANHFGLHAVAFSADNARPIGLNLAIREVLARSFSVIDILLGREPRFLGEKIFLEIE